jgi:hypothetical protein
MIIRTCSLAGNPLVPVYSMMHCWHRMRPPSLIHAGRSIATTRLTPAGTEPLTFETSGGNLDANGGRGVLRRQTNRGLCGPDIARLSRWRKEILAYQLRRLGHSCRCRVACSRSRLRRASRPNVRRRWDELVARTTAAPLRVVTQS